MRDDALKETVVGSEPIFKGAIFAVERLTVALPSGERAIRDVVRHGGAAAIVPVDEAGNVTLVRQCRVAAGRMTWEIPAGKLDHPGEDTLACAKRELSEETGLAASHWQKLTVIDTTPGFCTEQIAIYLATGLSQHAAHADADEFIATAQLPLSEAVARVVSGELRDSKTVAGLLLASLALREQPPVPSLIERATGAQASRADQ